MIVTFDAFVISRIWKYRGKSSICYFGANAPFSIIFSKYFKVFKTLLKFLLNFLKCCLKIEMMSWSKNSLWSKLSVCLQECTCLKIENTRWEFYQARLWERLLNLEACIQEAQPCELDIKRKVPGILFISYKLVHSWNQQLWRSCSCTSLSHGLVKLACRLTLIY